ncbi:unnamed protein product [Blepharisma stoltei]|uniref:Uncharacterized protein n=1 Tax=Blepharisma stoltei TaxID=1481888 RepID=A0AAU9K3D9_9CILI|nr:unnamed protein product [Blepharisma stoltei]
MTKMLGSGKSLSKASATFSEASGKRSTKPTVKIMPPEKQIPILAHFMLFLKILAEIGNKPDNKAPTPKIKIKISFSMRSVSSILI